MYEKTARIPTNFHACTLQKYSCLSPEDVLRLSDSCVAALDMLTTPGNANTGGNPDIIGGFVGSVSDVCDGGQGKGSSSHSSKQDADAAQQTAAAGSTKQDAHAERSQLEWQGFCQHLVELVQGVGMLPLLQLATRRQKAAARLGELLHFLVAPKTTKPREREREREGEGEGEGEGGAERKRKKERERPPNTCTCCRRPALPAALVLAGPAATQPAPRHCPSPGEGEQR